MCLFVHAPSVCPLFTGSSFFFVSPSLSLSLSHHRTTPFTSSNSFRRQWSSPFWIDFFADWLISTHDLYRFRTFTTTSKLSSSSHRWTVLGLCMFAGFSKYVCSFPHPPHFPHDLFARLFILFFSHELSRFFWSTIRLESINWFSIAVRVACFLFII